jgi:hypothetical protein
MSKEQEKPIATTKLSKEDGSGLVLIVRHRYADGWKVQRN